MTGIWRRTTCAALSALPACFWLASAAAVADPAADAARIDLQGDLLSVRVGSVPLAELLSRIGAQAGIGITIVGDLGPVRPQEFAGLPLAAAIRRLVEERHGLLMIYRVPRGGRDEARLHEIRVYADLADLDAASAIALQPAPPPERSVRMAEIRELLRQRDDAAIRRLASHLANDPEADVRRIVAGALTSIGGDAAAAALERALDDPDPVVRLQAARSLRTLRGDDAVEALSALARDDSDVEVRRTAVVLLSGLAGPQVASVLQDALSDSSAEVREAAERVVDQR